MTDDERATRIAGNEAIFREVNERIAESTERYAVPGAADFMCECGHRGCSEMLSMTLVTYEELRQDPKRFAVVPGHEITDVERVVERREGYLVVEKIGLGAEVAERTDPRA